MLSPSFEEGSFKWFNVDSYANPCLYVNFHLFKLLFADMSGMAFNDKHLTRAVSDEEQLKVLLLANYMIIMLYYYDNNIIKVFYLTF